MPMTPRTPTWTELAAEAIDGDTDAALELARRAPDKGFLPFLARWVPEGAMNPLVFNVFADAYDRMLMEKEAKAQTT